MNTKNVGDTIRALRKLRGFTQEDLAEKLGVSYQQVQKYENGETQLTIDRIHRIASALDVPVEELLSSTPEGLYEYLKPYEGSAERVYRLTRDESEFLKLFRKLKNPKMKDGLIKLLKGMIEEERKEDGGS
jgi:transcriptional regulator with XRE-family HTH domain